MPRHVAKQLARDRIYINNTNIVKLLKLQYCIIIEMLNFARYTEHCVP